MKNIEDSFQPHPETPLITLAILTVMTGIGAGFGAMALGLLLHLTQHIAYQCRSSLHDPHFIRGSRIYRRLPFALTAKYSSQSGVAGRTIFGFHSSAKEIQSSDV